MQPAICMPVCMFVRPISHYLKAPVKKIWISIYYFFGLISPRSSHQRHKRLRPMIKRHFCSPIFYAEFFSKHFLDQVHLVAPDVGPASLTLGTHRGIVAFDLLRVVKSSHST